MRGRPGGVPAGRAAPLTALAIFLIVRKITPRRASRDGRCGVGERLKGSEVWLLAELGRESLHGFALAGRLDDDPDAPAIGVATLYRTLDRLDDQGLIERDGGQARGKTQRQRWRLTAAGRRRLAAEAEVLAKLADTIRASLEGAGS